MPQNLPNFAKFQKNQLDSMVDFEKCCQSWNAYLLAKFRFDTAENERNFAENLPKIGNCLPRPIVSDLTERGGKPARSLRKKKAALSAQASMGVAQLAAQLAAQQAISQCFLWKTEYVLKNGGSIFFEQKHYSKHMY